jgi:hypothetical protein
LRREHLIEEALAHERPSAALAVCQLHAVGDDRIGGDLRDVEGAAGHLERTEDRLLLVLGSAHGGDGVAERQDAATARPSAVPSAVSIVFVFTADPVLSSSSGTPARTRSFKLLAALLETDAGLRCHGPRCSSPLGRRVDAEPISSLRARRVAPGGLSLIDSLESIGRASGRA